MPAPTDAIMIILVGATSFISQILLARGYQLEVASKVAAVNYLQVVPHMQSRPLHTAICVSMFPFAWHTETCPSSIHLH